jgi:hypothetical protein
MAIALPDLPWLATVKPQLIDFAADMTPALGGPTQRISRLGSRFAVAVSLPRLDQTQARAWIGARLKARTLGQTLIMAWPKPAPPGSLGSPEVDGGGQAGATLNAKGLTVGATVLAGSFFSFTVSGRNYLHCVTDDVVADGSGLAALSIAPLLRAPPANNAALEFVAPQIEGFVSGTTEDWDLDVLETFGTSFTLSEIE